VSARWLRTAVELVVLVVIWVALWADVSVANVVTGVLVAVGVLAVFDWRRGALDDPLVLRPVAAASFLLWFLWQLGKSNVAIARLVLTPRPDLAPGFVAYRLHTPSPGLATLVGNAVTLTPGTLTVTIDRTNATIYVHSLRAHDVAAVHRDLLELEWRALRAFGTRRELEAAQADRVAGRAGVAP
jgi:multicomponent Na+:H+ antiporter subunit E